MKTLVSLLGLAHATEENDVMLQSNRLQQHQQNNGKSEPPDIITGRGEVVPCKFDGVGFKDVEEDCTNQNFYTWWGEELYAGREKDSVPFVKPTFKQNERNVMDGMWSVTQVNQTAGWQTLCVAAVQTKGKTCKEWCAEQSTSEYTLQCYMARDDAHWLNDDLSEWLQEEGMPPTKCTIGAESSKLDKKQKSPRGDVFINTVDENGCLAEWRTQICGCAMLRTTSTTTPPPCYWAKSHDRLKPQWAREDCTYGDYHIYYGAEKQDPFVPPTYDASLYGSDATWNTRFNMSTLFNGACVAYINTDRKRLTCTQFCAIENMDCEAGIDDAHNQREPFNEWQAQWGFTPTYCTMFPFENLQRGVSAKWVNEDNNGCDQNWKTQICACKNRVP